MYLNRCVVYGWKKVVLVFVRACWKECGSRDRNRLFWAGHTFRCTGFHNQIPWLISTWVSYNFNWYKGCQYVFPKVLKYSGPGHVMKIGTSEFWEYSIGERFLVKILWRNWLILEIGDLCTRCIYGTFYFSRSCDTVFRYVFRIAVFYVACSMVWTVVLWICF